MKMFDDGSIVIPDPYETYISLLNQVKSPNPLESHGIRSIYMNVNGERNIESVVDPGSSITAMLEDVCHELGLTYNPKIHLPMQLANGSIDETLGLAHNVPCNLSLIILYMQIHIVHNPTYNILLGQPFDVLTESIIQNYQNEAQTITICDLNSS
jgi:hypothetical protein